MSNFVYLLELFSPYGQFAFTSNGFPGVYNGLISQGGFKPYTFDLAKDLDKKTYEFEIVVNDDVNSANGNLRFILSNSRSLSECVVRYSLVDAAASRPLFYGSVSKVNYTDHSFKITASSFITRLHYTKVFKASSICRWEFGSEECGVDLNAFSDGITITDIANNRLSVTTTGGLNPNEYLNGFITFNDFIQEIRFDVATNDADNIYLWDEIPVELLPTGGNLGATVFRGCKKDYITCKNTYNNIERWGAIPSREQGSNWTITSSKAFAGTKTISG